MANYAALFETIAVLDISDRVHFLKQCVNTYRSTSMLDFVAARWFASGAMLIDISSLVETEMLMFGQNEVENAVNEEGVPTKKIETLVFTPRVEEAYMRLAEKIRFNATSESGALCGDFVRRINTYSMPDVIRYMRRSEHTAPAFGVAAGRIYHAAKRHQTINTTNRRSDDLYLVEQHALEEILTFMRQPSPDRFWNDIDEYYNLPYGGTLPSSLFADGVGLKWQLNTLHLNHAVDQENENGAKEIEEAAERMNPNPDIIYDNEHTRNVLQRNKDSEKKVLASKKEIEKKVKDAQKVLKDAQREYDKLGKKGTHLSIQLDLVTRKVNQERRRDIHSADYTAAAREMERTVAKIEENNLLMDQSALQLRAAAVAYEETRHEALIEQRQNYFDEIDELNLQLGESELVMPAVAPAPRAAPRAALSAAPGHIAGAPARYGAPARQGAPGHNHSGPYQALGQPARAKIARVDARQTDVRQTEFAEPLQPAPHSPTPSDSASVAASVTASVAASVTASSLSESISSKGGRVSRALTRMISSVAGAQPGS